MQTDQVIFAVLKTAISNPIKDRFKFLTDVLFYRILEDEPEVLVYSNSDKDYQWLFEERYVKDFYDFLGNFKETDFVFRRIGESMDDYEFLGDCYCNFNKNMKYHDIEIVRKFEFPKKYHERVDTALRHFIEFIEPLNFDESINKFDINSLNYIYEGPYSQYCYENKITPNYENCVEFEFNGNKFTIIKKT